MALISRKQAADILGRPVSTISDWTKTGVLKPHKVKSVTYVDLDAVNALRDTEADIDRAVAERRAVLKDIQDEVRNLRRAEHYNLYPVRYAVKGLSEALGVFCERERQVFEAVLEGFGFSEIGDSISLSGERARQIFYRSAWRLNSAVRSYRKLLNEQISMRGELEKLRAELYDKDREIDKLRRQLDIPVLSSNDKRRRLLNTSLTEFNLSARVANGLHNTNIETVGQLTRICRREMMSIRNFGVTSVAELDRLLESVGLSWGNGKLRRVQDENGSRYVICE